MSTTNSPRKWRKSLFGGLGIQWPSVQHNQQSSPPPQNSSTTDENSNHQQKRHNSVSFAPPPPSPLPLSPTNGEGGKRSRGYSQSSWRPSSSMMMSGHHLHHGSVQSLVIRQKASTMQLQQQRRKTSTAMMARRPSTPSLPMSIVQAISGRLRRGSSICSLDEHDSAFCSAESCCSAASFSTSPDKRNSGLSSLSGGDAAPKPPTAPVFQWTAEQKAEIEAAFEQRCAHSIGHQWVNRQTLAWASQQQQSNSRGRPQELQLQESRVLCAEGKVQFHLLSSMLRGSLTASAAKRVVYVDRELPPNFGPDWQQISPSLRPYNQNNLKLI